MFGVKKDLFRAGTQKSHGIPDDVEIARRIKTQRVSGMAFAGLAEDGQHPCPAGKERHERGIVLGRMRRMVRAAKGRNPCRFQFTGRDLAEKLAVHGVRAGPAPFDVIHAQFVQAQGDLDLVRRGELHVLALGAVAQRGVIERVFPAHGVTAAVLPRRKDGD